MFAPLSMLIFASSVLTFCSAASCYLPNGDLLNTTVTYMCPTNGQLQGSMCCQSMGPSGDSGADKCVKVGDQDGSWLCENDDGSLWRRGCSDQSWDSSGCVNVCRNSSQDNNGLIWNAHAEPTTRCSDGSYCCAPASVGTPCCDNGSGFFIVNGAESKVRPSSAVSSSAASATTTVTQSSTATNSPSSHTSAGAIAGSVVGGSFGGALLMAAISFFLLSSYKKKQGRESGGANVGHSMDAKIEPHPSEIGETPRRHELSS